MGFFDKISVEYVEEDLKELYGQQATYTDFDFKEKKELKKHISDVMSNFTCPKCGGHKVKGENIEIVYGKVKMYKEVQKKGFFGNVKHTNELTDTIYRLYDVRLKNSGFLASGGFIKCKSCNWEIKGGSDITWMSINDLKNAFS